MEEEAKRDVDGEQLLGELLSSGLDKRITARQRELTELSLFISKRTSLENRDQVDEHLLVSQ